MRKRNHRHHDGTTIALTGTGAVMLYAAAAPLIILWYTVKVLAILALAVHDVIRAVIAARRAQRHTTQQQATSPARWSNRR